MKKLGVKSLTIMGLIAILLFVGVASSCSKKSTMPSKKTKKSAVIKENYKLKGTNKPRGHQKR